MIKNMILCSALLAAAISSQATELDVTSDSEFNPDCSYVVHLEGTTYTVKSVSAGKIKFDAVVDLNRFTDSQYKSESQVTLSISADNKSLAKTENYSTGMAGYWQATLSSGNYIADYSCVKKAK